MQHIQDGRNRQLSTSGDTLYDLLGVPKTATLEEIKKSYRKKALSCHPDKNKGDANATELFKQINHANGVLTDPVKKKIYDSYGSMGLHLASQIGEERFGTYLLLQKPWAKALCCFAFLITGCCFCCCCLFCCNCCCGKCGPQQGYDDDDYETFDTMESASRADSTPIVVAPTSGASGATSSSTFVDDREQLIEPDPKSPIALGPPPGQHGTYGSQ